MVTNGCVFFARSYVCLHVRSFVPSFSGINIYICLFSISSSSSSSSFALFVVAFYCCYKSVCMSFMAACLLFNAVNAGWYLNFGVVVVVVLLGSSKREGRKVLDLSAIFLLSDFV